jgi:hypothetical protein
MFNLKNSGNGIVINKLGVFPTAMMDELFGDIRFSGVLEDMLVDEVGHYLRRVMIKLERICHLSRLFFLFPFLF